MADLALRLAAFLEAREGKSVQWGVDDCTAVAAQWLGDNGVSVQLPLYHSQEEAHAIIEAAGGLVALWDRYLGDVSVRFDEPRLGDIGIIDTRRFGPIGVIVGKGGICCWRKEGGFFWIAPRNYLKVWAVS